MKPIETIIFDLGGVLIDWNPRYLYRKIFSDLDEMELFLKNVVHHDWNATLDEGRSFSEAVTELSTQHPNYAEMIAAYQIRWPEMMGDAIQGTVEILEALAKQSQVRLLALSNWSHETFPYARAKFPFLKLFETILVSGEEKMKKPEPAFYQLLQSRLQVEPSSAVFIDDVAANIEAAKQLGFQTIHYQSAQQLRADLNTLNITVGSSGGDPMNCKA